MRRAPREHGRTAGHQQPQIAAPHEPRERGEDAQLDAQRLVGLDGELEEGDREGADPAAGRRQTLDRARRKAQLEVRVAARARARAASPRPRGRDARPPPAGAGSARCCTPPPRAARRRASRPGASGRAPRDVSRSHRARRCSATIQTSRLPRAPRCPTARGVPGQVALSRDRLGPDAPRRLHARPDPGRATSRGRVPALARKLPLDSLAARAARRGGACTRWSIVLLGGLLAAVGRRSGVGCRGVARDARHHGRDLPGARRGAAGRASTSSASRIRRSAKPSWRPSRSSRRPARSSKRTAAAATRASASSPARSRATPRRSAGATPMDARDEARFLLHELTQDCVACHSRLPSQHDASLGRRLMSEERVAALPLDERARLEFATRQFERAAGDPRGAARLAGLQRERSRPGRRRSTNTSSSVCACAAISSGRPARSSASPRAPTSPAGCARGSCAGSRRCARSRPQARGDAARGGAGAARGGAGSRALPRRARCARLRPRGLRRAAPLRRRHAGRDRRSALAYFRLGEIESRVGRSFWLSQTEVYLETSIRMAPGEPFAPQALAQLQEFLVSGYTGSGGRQVPADVQKRLAELRGLVEQARARRAGRPGPRASSRASGGPMTQRAGARAGGGRGLRAADRLRDLPYPIRRQRRGGRDDRLPLRSRAREPCRWWRSTRRSTAAPPAARRSASAPRAASSAAPRSCARAIRASSR